MKFQKWWESIEDRDNYVQCLEVAHRAWDACKEESIKTIDKFHNVPAHKYIKEELEKEL